MANGLFSKFRLALGNGTHDLLGDTINAVLVNTASYTVALTTDEFLSDVSSGMRVSVATLASKTWALSTGTPIFDAADFSWTAVAAIGTDNGQAEGILFYNHDGNGASTDAARQLIEWMDTGMTGMPVTPNGGNINVTLNSSGIFSL